MHVAFNAAVAGRWVVLLSADSLCAALCAALLQISMLELQVQASTGRAGGEEGVSATPAEIITDLKQQVQSLNTKVGAGAL